MEAVKDETYNGWKNYPTWVVNLWLSNDEGLYNEALHQTEQAIEYADSRKAVPWAEGEGRVYEVAETLKNWVNDDLAPDLGASFAADLLGYALGSVDWYEIAKSWIESTLDQ